MDGQHLHLQVIFCEECSPIHSSPMKNHLLDSWLKTDFMANLCSYWNQQKCSADQRGIFAFYMPKYLHSHILQPSMKQSEPEVPRCSLDYCAILHGAFFLKRTDGLPLVVDSDGLKNLLPILKAYLTETVFYYKTKY